MSPFTWQRVRQALPLGLLLMTLASVSATTFVGSKWLRARQELEAIRLAVGDPRTLECLRADNQGSAAAGRTGQDKAPGTAARSAHQAPATQQPPI